MCWLCSPTADYPPHLSSDLTRLPIRTYYFIFPKFSHYSFRIKLICGFPTRELYKTWNSLWILLYSKINHNTRTTSTCLNFLFRVCHICQNVSKCVVPTRGNIKLRQTFRLRFPGNKYGFYVRRVWLLKFVYI